MKVEEILSGLFEKLYGEVPGFISELPPSGSARRYFRMGNDRVRIIGAWNQDIRENHAFFSYSRHFLSRGIRVPTLYACSQDEKAYLIEDLGDTLLLHWIQQYGKGEVTLGMYRRVVGELLRIQIRGAEGLDFSVGYPRSAFDRQSMAWDMNYFKYYFLKLAGVPFDEQALEDDFGAFAEYLLTAESRFFLYRDFQSRNIMIRNGDPWFIDYQGGRRGALQYDIASLLFEAKAFLPEDFRTEILQHYLRALSDFMKVDEAQFMEYFYAFALIRTMQAMGAYGLRGLYEKKPLFLESIPPALNHMRWLREHAHFPLRIPELQNVWSRLDEVDPSIGAMISGNEGGTIVRERLIKK